jgi:hypothetical protein
MAYLPDQSNYGPSWQRVMMVNLAGLAGGLLSSAVEFCSRGRDSPGAKNYCANATGDLSDRTARFALVGAGLGLFAGWMLTTNYDQSNQSHPAGSALSLLPMPGAIPVQSRTGGAELAPGLVSQGHF